MVRAGSRNIHKPTPRTAVPKADHPRPGSPITARSTRIRIVCSKKSWLVAHICLPLADVGVFRIGGKKMTTPGFTAQSSLYRSGRTYRQGLSSPAETAGGVFPQRGKLVCTNCVWDTYDYNGVPTCAKLCRYSAPPGQPQPEEFPVECDP